MPPVLRAVVVGQTPPPWGGQAVMIENTLNGAYRDTQLFHVRMAFSRNLSESGRLRVGKLLHVVGVIARIVAARVRRRATVLYYPPAGAGSGAPLARDIAVLCATRWMFARTVLHFHAAGVSEALPSLPGWARPLFRRALYDADVGIRTSALGPPDAQLLRARREFVIPNGVADMAGGGPGRPRRARPDGPPVILFVGLLRESKGVLVLLDACGHLQQMGIEFRLELVGEVHSAEFGRTMADVGRARGIEKRVHVRGVLVGAEKHDAYAGATVLAFPSFFESESFGLVLIEAMQFALPVVATQWRGIPSVVEEGGSGYLVPVRDSAALADRLGAVVTDPALARRLGGRGRQLYEERFTLARFHRDMQAVFDFVRSEGGA